MKGIYNMQLARTHGDSYYAIAEQHFWNSIACAEIEGTGRHNNVEVRRITLKHHISSNTVKAFFDSLGNPELSTLVFGRNKWDFTALTSCTKSQCPYAGMAWNFPWDERHGTFYQKWMKPSRLLAAAYLSNFYLITGNSEKCIEIAKEEHVFAYGASNTELFPMIFCPELASLFDENIQGVLGLFWLCKHLLGCKQIFEFCTCPILFVIYTQIQASLRVGDMELVNRAIGHFEVHCRRCSFGLNLYSCHRVLLEMACRILIRY